MKKINLAFLTLILFTTTSHADLKDDCKIFYSNIQYLNTLDTCSDTSPSLDPGNIQYKIEACHYIATNSTDLKCILSAQSIANKLQRTLDTEIPETPTFLQPLLDYINPYLNQLREYQNQTKETVLKHPNLGIFFITFSYFLFELYSDRRHKRSFRKRPKLKPTPLPKSKSKFISYILHLIRLLRSAFPKRPVQIPTPSPPPLRDPVTAQQALQLARSYLDEIDGGSPWKSPDVDDNNRSQYLDTLKLAARQLMIARYADPTATLTIETKDSPTDNFALRDLEAMCLFYEAHTRFTKQPTKAIAISERAAHIAYDLPLLWHSTGLFNFIFYNKQSAIHNHIRALSLDEGNLTFRKSLDRAQNLSPLTIFLGKFSWLLHRSLTLSAWSIFFITIALALALASAIVQFLNYTSHPQLSLGYILLIYISVLFFFGFITGLFKGLFLRGFQQFLAIFRQP